MGGCGWFSLRDLQWIAIERDLKTFFSFFFFPSLNNSRYKMNYVYLSEKNLLPILLCLFCFQVRHNQ